MKRLVRRFEGPLAVYLGATLLLVGAVSAYWDIATHIDVGRERFLTPAHLGIYSTVLPSALGVALSGLADHFRAGESFVAALRHPFRRLRPGIAVAGAGLLTTLIAAPFDNAWHEIYGIDVTIWSPPHLLAIFGIAAGALGLAAVVSPAATRASNGFYPVLLAGFLTTLLVTTAEFEFDAPQYRIAYHPLLLAGISAFVLVAAGGERWRATKVALWFELVRVASVLFLLAVGRSLPYVPVVLPAAVLVDVLALPRFRPAAAGVVIGATVIVGNWTLLELLPGLRWPMDDLALGAPLGLLLAAVAGWLGGLLGARLDGVDERTRSSYGLRRAATVMLILTCVLVASPAFAHEVGGKRGGGVIEWTPAVPEPGQTITVHISDVALSSGSSPRGVRLEAWRAEHRIQIPVEPAGDGYRATTSLPEQGLWFLFIRARADGEDLLWGDHFSVADDGAGVGGSRRQRFTLGVDTLADKEPAAWVDGVAYGLALLILLLLVRGVVRALARLPRSVGARSG